ncbi:MAG TPA: gluconokinase [Vicinamibacterales bacterium]|nr:gluconokinase [Vicinamibacterales bacterium]
MVIVVMGVAGSGKTTVGEKLADALGAAFLDADALHPAENIDKMARGIPLDDEDRAPWLERVHARVRAAFAEKTTIVVACSALKQRYRDQIAGGIPITWVYLRGSRALVQDRLAHRQGHFMPATLLDSQFRDLEEPHDAIDVDISLSPDAIVQRILAELPARSPSPLT